ncbi:hypothetical protein Patl1_32863 [Pistacia atlantica]|uniref:Uncharacterized protein n=1 Tax=Pistacia atlantica TaxID=434234 RepID=A0ACC1AM43_9ROSI|nr:hypothetical protein Patl1_32863 [Pistacia atlantica]
MNKALNTAPSKILILYLLLRPERSLTTGKMAATAVAPVQPSLDSNQGQYDVKLFNRWTFDDVQVVDISLNDYIGVQAAKHATYVPHTAGSFQEHQDNCRVPC